MDVMGRKTTIKSKEPH